MLNNNKIISGKVSFFKEAGIKMTSHQLRDIEREKDKGYNTTLVGYNNELVGFFVLADEVKPETKSVIGQLKNLGIEKFVMLSGDNEKVSERVAKEVGITDYHANLLPEDKLNYLKKYLNKNYKVLAMGDGVNDTVILNASDIGVAMGGIGADVTIESGDIVLMQDNLLRVVEMMHLAKITRRIARQDFVIWGITNVAGLLMVFSNIIPRAILPIVAAAYNFITDFVPIMNSIRLFKLHLKKH